MHEVIQTLLTFTADLFPIMLRGCKSPSVQSADQQVAPTYGIVAASVWPNCFGLCEIWHRKEYTRTRINKMSQTRNYKSH